MAPLIYLLVLLYKYDNNTIEAQSSNRFSMFLRRQPTPSLGFGQLGCNHGLRTALLFRSTTTATTRTKFCLPTPSLSMHKKHLLQIVFESRCRQRRGDVSLQASSSDRLDLVIKSHT
jgi:hypothetical protein